MGRKQRRSVSRACRGEIEASIWLQFASKLRPFFFLSDVFRGIRYEFSCDQLSRYTESSACWLTRYGTGIYVFPLHFVLWEREVCTLFPSISIINNRKRTLDPESCVETCFVENIRRQTNEKLMPRRANKTFAKTISLDRPAIVLRVEYTFFIFRQHSSPERFPAWSIRFFVL